MKIENLKLSEIKPYERNPRKNDRAVEPVAESIRQFGFKQPIVVDKDGVIVAGHTRYKAAQKLGLETVPCVRADDLTPAQVKAYRIADNKLNELATWDFAMLDEELKSIDFNFEPFDFGFESYDFVFQTAAESESASAPEEKEKGLRESRSELNEMLRDGEGALAQAVELRYGVYVEVDSEETQRELYERLTKEGFSVKTTTI